MAVKNGNADIMDLLLSKGANVDAKNRKGDTPLNLVYMLPRGGIAARIAELLLSQGADVNEGNNSGITPLYRSALAGFNSFTELLIRYGADVNARTSSGATPLHCAASNKRVY